MIFNEMKIIKDLHGIFMLIKENLLLNLKDKRIHT